MKYSCIKLTIGCTLNALTLSLWGKFVRVAFKNRILDYIMVIAYKKVFRIKFLTPTCFKVADKYVYLCKGETG